MRYFSCRGEVIESVNFNRLTFEELWNFTGGDVDSLVVGSETPGDAYCMLLKTDYGDIEIQEGDYVIKNVKGRFYAMKPDVFEIYYIHVPNVITDIPEGEYYE